MVTPEESALRLGDAEGNITCPVCNTTIPTELVVCLTCTNRCYMRQLHAFVRIEQRDGRPWIPALDLNCVELASFPGGEHIAESLTTWVSIMHLSCLEFMDRDSDDSLPDDLRRKVWAEIRARGEEYEHAMKFVIDYGTLGVRGVC